jgi:hypothetical protein
MIISLRDTYAYVQGPTGWPTLRYLANTVATEADGLDPASPSYPVTFRGLHTAIHKIVTYEVRISTGDVSAAGTDANVFITLHGQWGSAPERALDNAHENNFERGASDLFALKFKKLGRLKSVRIRHDNWGNTPGWFVEEIRVRRLGALKTVLFPVHRWLASDEGDCAIDLLCFPNSTPTPTPGVPHPCSGESPATSVLNLSVGSVDVDVKRIHQAIFEITDPDSLAQPTVTATPSGPDLKNVTSKATLQKKSGAWKVKCIVHVEVLSLSGQTSATQVSHERTFQLLGASLSLGWSVNHTPATAGQSAKTTVDPI